MILIYSNWCSQHTTTGSLNNRFLSQVRQIKTDDHLFFSKENVSIYLKFIIHRYLTKVLDRCLQRCLPVSVWMTLHFERLHRYIPDASYHMVDQKTRFNGFDQRLAHWPSCQNIIALMTVTISQLRLFNFDRLFRFAVVLYFFYQKNLTCPNKPFYNFKLWRIFLLFSKKNNYSQLSESQDLITTGLVTLLHISLIGTFISFNSSMWLSYIRYNIFINIKYLNWSNLTQNAYWVWNPLFLEITTNHFPKMIISEVIGPGN